MKVKDIRSRHVIGCMENGSAVIKGIEKDATPNTKKRIKTLLNGMLDYALQYELIDRNYARDTALPNNIQRDLRTNEQHHIPFEEIEMKKLWVNLYVMDNVDLLLIQCYSGWRPQEIGLIELKNVDLDNWTFRGGIKTEAGENRTVPIHTRIRELVRKRYDEALSIHSKYLFNYKKNIGEYVKLTYARYQYTFYKIRDALELNPEHKPHDGRVHFVTMAKEAKMDEYAIKYIIGHRIDDITERVYTHRNIEWLIDEMTKIK